MHILAIDLGKYKSGDRWPLHAGDRFFRHWHAGFSRSPAASRDRTFRSERTQGYLWDAVPLYGWGQQAA